MTTFWGGDFFGCALKLSHFGKRVAGDKGKGAFGNGKIEELADIDERFFLSRFVIPASCISKH